MIAMTAPAIGQRGSAARRPSIDPFPERACFLDVPSQVFAAER